MTTSIPAQYHDEQMFTTQELAEITGIARATFEGWRCRGNGGPKPTRLGPQIIRYRWVDIKAWRESLNTEAA
jgi:predicted DNA-binding transcriptional regulator AlpA